MENKIKAQSLDLTSQLMVQFKGYGSVADSSTTTANESFSSVGESFLSSVTHVQKQLDDLEQLNRPNIDHCQHFDSRFCVKFKRLKNLQVLIKTSSMGCNNANPSNRHNRVTLRWMNVKSKYWFYCKKSNFRTSVISRIPYATVIRLSDVKDNKNILKSLLL